MNFVSGVVETLASYMCCLIEYSALHYSAENEVFSVAVSTAEAEYMVSASAVKDAL
jgi:hypothetical protein